MDCQFPHKLRYKKNEAKRHLGYLQRNGRKGLHYYKCPSGGHWHMGRRNETN